MRNGKFIPVPRIFCRCYLMLRVDGGISPNTAALIYFSLPTEMRPSKGPSISVTTFHSLLSSLSLSIYSYRSNVKRKTSSISAITEIFYLYFVTIFEYSKRWNQTLWYRVNCMNHQYVLINVSVHFSAWHFIIT